MAEATGGRCAWAGRGEPDRSYHDLEWGVPRGGDAELFEALTLEGAQAGLSWSTILRKRDGYRRLFRGFDPNAVAALDDDAVDALLQDPAIVRHRGKIESTLNNARALLQVREEFGSFGRYIWTFVDGRPIQNRWRSMEALPSTTPVSVRLSRDLKKRGFRFVGPTTCYAFMQAVGMVNDHEIGCFRHDAVSGLMPDLGR